MRLEKSKTSIDIILLVLILLVSVSFSSAAVVSHSPAQVTPGTFAAGNYAFPNNLSVSENVGIGTSNPSYSLDVSGTGRFTSYLTIENGAPIQLFTETDQADPAGRWRIVADGGSFNVRKRGSAGTWTGESYPLNINSAGVLYTNGNEVWHEGNDGAGSGLDADTLDGYSANVNSLGTTWGYIPAVYTNGVTEVGRYIDFHHTSNNGVDYSTRLHTDGSNNGRLYINSNMIWHAGNDGSGSGLAADTLDGISSASFLRSDASDTLNGALTINSGLWHISLKNSGTYTGIYFDDGTGSYDAGIYHSNDILRIGKYNDATAGWVSTPFDFNLNSGVATAHVAGGSWSTSSDRRLKDNISQITGALDKVSLIEGVEYDWKTNSKHDIGVIAQDVEKVFPEVVNAPQNESLDYYSVDYSKFAPLLIEAVKELRSEKDLQIEQLKAEKDLDINELKIENKILKDENQAIKQSICSMNQAFEFCS